LILFYKGLKKQSLAQMRPVVSGADDESSAEPDQTSWHDINRQLPFRRKRWHLAGQRLEHYSPVSKLPMMVSAPKRAFRHAAPRGAPPGPASLRNCHDRVVCSWRPRLGNTDTTPGCPGRHRLVLVSLVLDRRETRSRRGGWQAKAKTHSRSRRPPRRRAWRRNR
jgi:hypothetical protein